MKHYDISALSIFALMANIQCGCQSQNGAHHWPFESRVPMVSILGSSLCLSDCYVHLLVMLMTTRSHVITRSFLDICFYGFTSRLIPVPESHVIESPICCMYCCQFVTSAPTFLSPEGYLIFLWVANPILGFSRYLGRAATIEK